MANTRQKLSGDMRIFTTNLIDRRVFITWENAIPDMNVLREALRREVKTFCTQRIDVCYMDARFLQSLAEAYDEMDDGLPIKLDARRDGIKIAGSRESEFIQLRIDDLNELPFGIWYMLVLNTWRAMVQKKSGPMPGVNFNITIAGIVFTCLRLNVPIEFQTV
jgi:hypothetical protein